ncbi:class I SAM-dependent methyltransferase [Lacticaseibacillus thailandensis]|uniref:16S RNA methylase n=1 Tax=Lacticaseibacillus thailandensis DSM 22698 = JCM 13996 TaxID=1423810 RepID=A0A0R2CEI9_9LACO|nr:methyltransferase [Lacticaseibacillus thailandensis]KRM86793.1 16S RNA methylase [Lacticaseibacillus thailandensis DSM 22698 = JCM 13996]
MEHYYTNNPDVAHDEVTFNFPLAGHDVRLTTDSGVFSRHTVDYGSRVLIATVAQRTTVPSGDVADIGCGYGPIGIALALAWPDRHVWMSDVNERALGLATRNAATNGVADRTTIVESSAFDNVPPTDLGVVVTNPPVRAGKDVVNAILTGAFSHLRRGGELFVVLQKKQGAPSAKRLLQATFGNCDVLRKDKGYYILHSIKG